MRDMEVEPKEILKRIRDEELKSEPKILLGNVKMKTWASDLRDKFNADASPRRLG